jgi:phosphoheptose isomerase
MKPQDWRIIIQAQLAESARVKQRTAERCLNDIENAATLLLGCLENGGKILLCGNGGSAADCQHIAAEFVSVLRRDFLRPPLAAISLTTDTSFLTASGNDFGFDGVFSRQVEALGHNGDVLIGISTSGNSANVVQAILQARELGVRTIALTGSAGGRLAELAEVAICVPSESTQHIQETHIALGHILCFLVEEALFTDNGTLRNSNRNARA